MNFLYRPILALVVLAFTVNTLVSQTGPGGVGKTDGTSSLKLWLDAADVATKTLNSTTVSQWGDKSGSLSHGTQGLATKQPTNNATGINSLQTITFDGSNDAFDLPTNSVLTTNAPCSFFCLMKPANLTGYRTLYCAGLGGGYTAFETNGLKLNYYDVADGVQEFNGTTSLVAGTVYIFDANLTAGSGTAVLSFNLNGTNDLTSAATTFGGIIASNPERTVGGTGASQFWNGEIGEMIIYNAKLNSAQRKIVGSYLSSKWGVSFSGSTYGGTSSYSERVIGIGQESDGSNTSATADGLALTSNSSINANGEYLLAGHNAGANSTVTSDVVASVTHRWNRIWYLDKTGTLDGGNVQIGFDFSDGGLGGTPSTAANYRLLYRSGTSGNFSEITTATSAILGDNVNFTVTDANLLDGYYTIGTINNSSSPLPVEMSNLSASSQAASAKLTWSTATETNNYGFEIERREINSQFAKVGFVDGSGTSSSPHEYSFIDREVSAGRYAYRIKQIDKEGSFKYTGEVEVEVGMAPKEFNLVQNYPNPFNPSTTIEFTLPTDGHAVLKVVDMLGREVVTLFDGEAKAGYYNRIAFDASRFASGTYFTKLDAGGKQMLKKMVLMK